MIDKIIVASLIISCAVMALLAYVGRITEQTAQIMCLGIFVVWVVWMVAGALAAEKKTKI